MRRGSCVLFPRSFRRAKPQWLCVDLSCAVTRWGSGSDDCGRQRCNGNLRFRQGNDIARHAVRVAHACVTAPRILLLAADFLLAWKGGIPPLAGVIALVVTVVGGWRWWSFFIPRWRMWAIEQGADPKELQRLALANSLVWPDGHFLEKTEFRPR
jgi:hypothetical protein